MQGGQGHPALCMHRRKAGRATTLLVLALMLVPCAAHAQSFMQQFMREGVLDNPQALGMDPAAMPPDLDEPEIGEDAETAPFAQETDGKAKASPAPRYHAGQSHDPPPALPLASRLRRVLRDSPLGGNSDLWFTRQRVRDVYFLAVESSAHDRYLSVGSKHAVRGDFSSPGWRFLSTLGVKIAAYEPPLIERISYVDLMRMMPGYEARIGNLTIAGYAGLGYARSQARGILATGRFGRFGGAALGEFWYNWGQNAPALARFTSGYIVADTANRSATVGLRHGIGLPELVLPALPVLIGPEASWSAGRDVRSAGAALHTAFRKGRIGAHASEIPLLAARLRVSAGAQWQDKRKPGAYAEMAAYLAY